MKEYEVVIRDEREADVSAITEVTVAAFATLEISNNTEQFIIRALRDAGVLALSLVAESDGSVVGHIAISPVVVSDGSKGWYMAWARFRCFPNIRAEVLEKR